MRWLTHLLTTRWSARRRFPVAALDALEAAIAAGERQHRGELRVVIEPALDLAQILAGITPRQRAVRAFAELGVWDTAENNGVLLYIGLADRAVEIVADRGYRDGAGHVPAATWAQICTQMSTHFSDGRFQDGVLHGVAAVAAVMAGVFPGDGSGPDELPNRPTFI